MFVIYPATSQYANYFSFQWRQKINVWEPWIVGIIKHPSGARTLSFAISSDEGDIKSDAKASDLRRMHQMTKHLADKIGAKSTHFAGIIPGCLKYRRVSRPNTEQEATSIAVVKAIQYEVYPAPDREVLECLHSKGVPVYHLAGVRAKTWPTFPGAYHGAVPCCGAIPTEHYEVILKKL